MSSIHKLNYHVYISVPGHCVTANVHSGRRHLKHEPQEGRRPSSTLGSRAIQRGGSTQDVALVCLSCHCTNHRQTDDVAGRELSSSSQPLYFTSLQFAQEWRRHQTRLHFDKQLWTLALPLTQIFHWNVITVDVRLHWAGEIERAIHMTSGIFSWATICVHTCFHNVSSGWWFSKLCAGSRMSRETPGAAASSGSLQNSLPIPERSFSGE